MLTHDPLRTLLIHNQRRSRLRATRAAAPFYHMLRGAGQFKNDEEAMTFAHELVHGTRGCDSLCDHFDVLTAKYGLTRFDPDIPLTDDKGNICTLAEYLRIHEAPPQCIEAAHVLDEARDILCPELNLKNN